MSINKEAKVKIGAEGGDQTKREFEKAAGAGVKAGRDIADAFKAAGAAVSSFGVSVVDAVVDVGSLNPAVLTKTLEEYTRTVTRMAVATGQSVSDLTAKYNALGRANGVMPQQIDAFAKSLGRLTYDAKGAIDAYQGMHNAAVAFNETDQEQVPFASYLKNVKGVASDTTAAVDKLFAQSQKLGTVGGPRALRDLYVSLGTAIDSTVSKVGSARDQTEAFFGLLTKGMTAQHAQRVAGAEMNFLAGSGLDIQRTLGYDPFDKQGHYKNPVQVERDLFAAMKRRGMTDEQMLRAYRQSNGVEGGTSLFWALKEGRFKDVAGLAGLKGGAASRAANEAYLGSDIGKIDAGNVEAFIGKTGAAAPLLNLKAKVAQAVGEYPFIAAGVAVGIKAAIKAAAPKLVGAAARRGLAGAAGSALSVAAGPVGIAASVLDSSDVSTEPHSDRALAELIHDRAAAGVRTPAKADDLRRAESALAAQGVNAAALTTEQIAAALKIALDASTVKVQVQGSTSATTEADKDSGSRN